MTTTTAVAPTPGASEQPPHVAQGQPPCVTSGAHGRGTRGQDGSVLSDPHEPRPMQEFES
jgi:hypothetical protein